MPAKILQSEQSHAVRQINGRVDVSGGVPSVGSGEGFTLVDTGAGQVQVVLSNPGRAILGAHGTPLESTLATAHSVKVISKTEASDVLFGVYAADATDGVLVDNVGFYFTIVVSDIS